MTIEFWYIKSDIYDLVCDFIIFKDSEFVSIEKKTKGRNNMLIVTVFRKTYKETMVLHNQTKKETYNLFENHYENVILAFEKDIDDILENNKCFSRYIKIKKLKGND